MSREMSIQDILKTSNIITIKPHEKLSKALSKLSTSHDAAFLLSKKKHLLGVINPYYCLLRSSYPRNAEVERCIHKTSFVHLEDSPQKVADLFIRTKIHYLPVYNTDNEFAGIVSARDFLRKIAEMKVFETTVSDFLAQKRIPLTTIGENDSLSTAFHIFKMTKYSKLVVTNGKGRLKGILSYYDLVCYLASPESVKRSANTKAVFYLRKVKDLAKTYVLTLKKHNVLKDAIRCILDKKIGSVIIVDNNKCPLSIITTKDLLRFFIQKGQGETMMSNHEKLLRKSRLFQGGFLVSGNRIGNRVKTGFYTMLRTLNLFLSSFHRLTEEREKSFVKQK